MIRERTAEIAKRLSPAPAGFGRPIVERQAWDPLRTTPQGREALEAAEALLKQPLPVASDEAYLDFSRSGNRTRGQSVISARRGRVRTLTLAECLEDRGRFLSPLAETIASLCAERTWVLPAHDRALENFNAQARDIDLASAELAWELATALHLLGDRLDSAARELARRNIRERVLMPFEEMVQGQRRPNWWLTGRNNWNAVCLAGVVGAALALEEAPERRAFFVAAAEHYIGNYLKGFTRDGYCSEGVGYWNYGFGHFAYLSEAVYRATQGRLNWFERPEVGRIAAYGEGIEIVQGVVPAFSDCSVSARPEARILELARGRLPLAAGVAGEAKKLWASGLASAMLYQFPDAPPAPLRRPVGSVEAGRRTWFEAAQVLICRPEEGLRGRFGAAIKGGHNAEHHNHNDVGSYVVAVDHAPVLLDAGAEVYTARTFSGRRYESKVLSSYGHPVPVVAGRLQRAGAEARAQVRKVELTPQGDRLELDLSAAYAVAGLRRLVRTFTYDRAGAGSVTVRDEVEFDAPAEFSTALVTLGEWRRGPDGALRIAWAGRAVAVRLTVEPPLEFEIRAETLDEDVRAPARPTRLGVYLKDKVARAAITAVIAPAE